MEHSENTAPSKFTFTAPSKNTLELVPLSTGASIVGKICENIARIWQKV